ncbi:MAG: acyl-CoA dehydrogenase family protein [Bacteroidia bacterium]|nr:acyl-CoA dehydrogenase family protein [Bacteroidia bacterium]
MTENSTSQSQTISQDTRKTGQNRVLSANFKESANFFFSDRMLRAWLRKYISPEGYACMEEKWILTGAAAAGPMNELSSLADKKTPELIKRNTWGEEINEIRFHPSYDRLLDHAVQSGMFRVKWEPTLRENFRRESHSLGFASGLLFAMTELSQFCPLCMTDGVARLIDLFCEEEDRQRLLPHIYTDRAEELFTGAMFLTEKAGGSDVGANLVKATQVEGANYVLNGEKWFCSNANAELIFALARTDENIRGTRGLSIFLVEKNLPDGRKNHMNFIRLKDKLGVRSMASAEIIMENTAAKRVGEEFQGFPIMAQMINLSRLYNSVAALAGGRRALIEAWQFLNARHSFGRIAVEHALVRDKLLELGALHTANFYLVWRAIRALDAADNGDESESQLLRLLTPMVKKWSAETACYLARECMELMGGMGYIEDTPLPRIMRDVMVLPIWEGAGNIMSLDMLRALGKSEGLKAMATEIQGILPQAGEYKEVMQAEWLALQGKFRQMAGQSQDELELEGKYAFARLTTLYQMALLVAERDPETQGWVDPSLKFFAHRIKKDGNPLSLMSVEQIGALIAWDIQS